MSDLLAQVVDAHGGMRRWDQISRFRAEVSFGGTLWAEKSMDGLLHEVVVEGETRDQRLKICPFPWPGRHATWEPYRETIQTDDGMLVAERRDPAASFADVMAESRWDDLHVVYLTSEATWNYFVTPFIFVRPDFTVEEIEPRSENGEVWRRLVVTYPAGIAAHCRRQTYSFDAAGFLRRLDYSVDILRGGPVVQYVSDYREFDRIMVPTRRLVHVGGPDSSPRGAPAVGSIEVMAVKFG